MRQIEFKAEAYELNEKNVLVFKKTDEEQIGLFELIWTIINHPGNPNQLKNKKDTKLAKKVRQKLKEISRYKDKDKDARVLAEGDKTILLEEDEFEMLTRLLSDFPGHPSLAEDFSRMWDFLDSVPEKKLELIKDGSNSNDNSSNSTPS